MKNGKVEPLCIKCGETDVIKIGKCSRFTNGYRSQCKACDKQYYEDNKAEKLLKAKEYRETKLDKVKAKVYSKQYRDINKDALSVKKSKYYELTKERDKERRKAYADKYRALHRSKRNIKSAERKALRLEQTPLLVLEEKRYIKAIYLLSSLFKTELKISTHIDHIIPIHRGGLHHPLNLQLVTAEFNLSKGSKLPEVIPSELKALHNNFYKKEVYE